MATMDSPWMATLDAHSRPPSSMVSIRALVRIRSAGVSPGETVLGVELTGRSEAGFFFAARRPTITPAHMAIMARRTANGRSILLLQTCEDHGGKEKALQS